MAILKLSKRNANPSRGYKTSPYSQKRGHCSGGTSLLCVSLWTGKDKAALVYFLHKLSLHLSLWRLRSSHTDLRSVILDLRSKILDTQPRFWQQNQSSRRSASGGGPCPRRQLASAGPTGSIARVPHCSPHCVFPPFGFFCRDCGARQPNNLRSPPGSERSMTPCDNHCRKTERGQEPRTFQAD